MKIIGYGICASGEAKRYLKATLNEFARLCDETIILVNGYCSEEIKLINDYGFRYVVDEREWGTNQWRIKEDFVRDHVSKLAKNGDRMVCLDMDEVFEPTFTREKYLNLPGGPAWVVFICNLWDEGWHEQLSFWNVRLWEWNGDIEWERKPLHCGLAPLWARKFVTHAPYVLLHYGLKDKEDRLKKYDRYLKYDPSRAFLRGNYYDELRRAVGKPFDLDKVHKLVAEEVASYKERRKEVRGLMAGKKFVFVRRLKDGAILDIPESHLTQTLKQGFELYEIPPQKPEVKVNELACVICGFQAKNTNSLKTHMRMKHK